ncbi:MAG TPA: ATP-binding protein [Xanthobacteraceae bacterium]|nr:ATP-binding protein [Xanthobacteraceae bacterium]
MNVAVERKTFGVTADEVGAIDRWVEAVAAQWGESERTAFRARVCIAELAANVLEHGTAQPGDDRIMVTLQQFGDGIGIEFQDSRSPSYDPTRHTAAAKATSIEAASPSGYGLMLVRAYGSDIAYSNDGGRNRITLKIKSA